MVHITRSLVEALLADAEERDPGPLTVGLAVTPASDFEGVDLPPDVAVFTHFYLPDAGRSVTGVFGVDLSTPPGRTPGLFISHPNGSPTPSKTDDLRELVFIAVPPWDVDSVRVYGRDGRRRELELLDATPPAESPP